MSPDEADKYIVKTKEARQEHAKFLIQRAMALESENEELTILLDISLDALKGIDHELTENDVKGVSCNHVWSAIDHIEKFIEETKAKAQSK